MIGHKKSVSLSMKMRTDAAKLDRSLSRSSSVPGQASASSLPMINAAENFKMTMSKRERMMHSTKQEISSDSASGNIDAVSSGGVFADREMMTMVSAQCVRCGESASCCMSCTEFLAEEALNFYRKTRARGAASLFANAITQTGVTVVVKYMIFSLWKNGFLSRKWSSKKKEFKADLWFRYHYLRYTFKAWVTFKTHNLVERRDKRIEEAEKRAAALEALANQAENMKKGAEMIAKKLTKEKDGYVSVIEKQARQIEELKESLAKERSRVVGLSSLSTTLLELESLASTLGENDSKDVHNRLYIAAASQLPNFDYGKTFNEEDTADLIVSENKRRDKGKIYKPDQLDEDVEMIEWLMNWASSKSRDAGTGQDPVSGKPLDTVLPKYKKINTWDDMKNGAQLLRLVISLIWDSPLAKTGTSLRLPIPEGMEVPPSATPSFDFEGTVNAVKAAKSSFDTITLALDLAVTHLGVPKFQMGDIADCRPDVYTAFMGYLMIACSSPASHSSNLGRVSKLITDYEEVAKRVQDSRAFIMTGQIKKIKTRWEELQGITSVKIVETVVNEAGVSAQSAGASEEKTDSAETKEDKEGGGGGGGEAAAEGKDSGGSSDEGKQQGSEQGQKADDEAKEKVPEKEVDPELAKLEKYFSLTGAIDEYLSLLGVPNEEFIYSKQAGPVREQVQSYGESVEELKILRKNLAVHNARLENSYKVSNDVRNAMSKFQFECLINQLNWIE